MQSSDNQRIAVRARRKPRVSMTRARQRVSRTQGVSLLTKKNEIVIKRPVRTEEAGELNIVQQARMKQLQQREKASLARPMVSTPKKIQASVVKNTMRPTSQELKQAAIQKAMMETVKKSKSSKHKANHIHFGFKRILIATVCATVAVFAIVYFVNLNAPNISLKVAAMQSGIDASYPAYVPRDFNLSDITSENGKITLNFKNVSSGDAFTIIEEKSSWDSNALLNNFVQDEYGDNYVAVREQGLTLYINGSNAAWVNGGVAYKIKTTSGSLTKKQIKNIAVSL